MYKWLCLYSVSLLLLVGCDKQSAPESQSPSTPSVVRIGYFANLTHAQAVLGVSSGEFQNAIAPAKLETRVFNAGPALIEALNAGEIDIAYVGPGPAISAHTRSRGEAIRVIAGAAANGVLVVAQKGSGIRSLADLKGKRIATPQAGNTQDIAARHFLQQAIGDTSGVFSVPNAEQRGLMERGEIDAAWVPEPWGAFLVSEAGATPILEEKDLWPDNEFVLTVVVTTPAFLKNHPATVESFLRVHRNWTRRLTDDPAAHVARLGDALFSLTQKKLPPTVLTDAIKRVRFGDEPLPASLEAMNRWMHELGFSRTAGTIDGLVDTSLLHKLADESSHK